MRGLLYNQFGTFRMPLICISVMQVVFLIVTIVDRQNSYSVDFGFNACIIMPYIIFLLINAELFRFSENQIWRNFAISTPISVKGQVAVKYVFTIMIYAAILLFGVFSYLIATLMTGENQFTHMQAGLIYGLFGDVSFLFGDSSAQDLYNFMKSPPIKLMTWLIPTIAVALFVISYIVSLPLCRKGIERSES